MTEQSGNVAFQYAGTVNLASTLGKEQDLDSLTLAYLNPTPSFAIASVNSAVDDYNLVITPPNFSSGVGFGGLISGDNLLFESAVNLQQIWLPNNYVSGSLISGSLTFSGSTITSLGLTPGTYTWTWENGGVSDFLEMRVGVSAVPEPSSVALSIVGCALLVSFRRRQALKSLLSLR